MAKSFLQQNVELRNLLNEETPFESWRKSSIKQVNDLAHIGENKTGIIVHCDEKHTIIVFCIWSFPKPRRSWGRLLNTFLQHSLLNGEIAACGIPHSIIKQENFKRAYSCSKFIYLLRSLPTKIIRNHDSCSRKWPHHFLYIKLIFIYLFIFKRNFLGIIVRSVGKLKWLMCLMDFVKYSFSTIVFRFSKELYLIENYRLMLYHDEK